ncbi:MAG: helix-turn-helix domain-containing protein [Pseudomonadota bacterium]
MAQSASFLPRAMGEADAAKYIGLSPTTLRSLGIPRRVYGSRRLYERADLDDFLNNLPFESPKGVAPTEGSETCDDAKKAFG